MFAIQIDNFSLKKIYETNQAVNWALATLPNNKNKKYVIICGDKITMAEQTNNWLKLACSEEDFWNFWYYYFDLGFDYKKAEIDAYMESKKMLFKKVCVVSKGLRIINQNFTESIICSILSFAGYNRDFIKRFIRLVSKAYNYKKRKNTLVGQTIEWYVTPTFEQIAESPDIIHDLLSFDSDTANKIICICQELQEAHTSPEYLKSIGFKATMQMFKGWSIISPQEASMICVNGLNMKDGLVATKTLKKYIKIEGINFDDFKQMSNRGLLAKQLLFYEKNLKEFERNGLQ